MRICQFSDWHIYYTPEKSVMKTIEQMSKEKDIDVIIGCGDYTGSKKTEICIDKIVTEIRQAFPNIPFGSVLGNHDMWLIERKHTKSNHNKQMINIIDSFQENNVHFFDKDGPLFVNNLVFVGHTGWYNHTTPPTNDSFWMAQFQENTHNRMKRVAQKETTNNLNKLKGICGEKVVYVSHFNVINDGIQDWKGGFEVFGGDPNIGRILQDDYNCSVFLCGHAHMLRKGPLVWECGSDYGLPKYQIIELEDI